MEEFKIKGKLITTGEIIDMVIYWDNNTTDNYSNLFKCSYNDVNYEVSGYRVLDTFNKLIDRLLEDDIGLDVKGALINTYQDELQSQSINIYLLDIENKNKTLCSLFDYSDNNEYPNSVDKSEYLCKWNETISINSQKIDSDNKKYIKKSILRFLISIFFTVILILLFYFYIFRR